MNPMFMNNPDFLVKSTLGFFFGSINYVLILKSRVISNILLIKLFISKV
ncbi:hypothetical protein MARINOS108_20034 [Marinoscillum sp. 108]|nr:hypothetical protein MARINOS108_20034 [Marinoscillum sp. 108]